jgi:hypothetical protein
MNQVAIFTDELPKIYRLLRMYLVPPSQASALPALSNHPTRVTIDADRDPIWMLFLVENQ